MCTVYMPLTWADLGKGFWGCNPHKWSEGQSYSSVVVVPSHARALIYIAKSLVVVVVSSKQVVKNTH